VKTTINLSGVSETMLIPLYARALESRKPNRVIEDQAAIEMVERLDFDFAKFDKGKLSIWGCVTRTVIFDRELKKYLEKRPDCVCVNIGCGLDTRFRRVDNGKMLWRNLDLRPVIDIRNQLLPDREREMSLAESVFDNEWAKKIPQRDAAVFVIEGTLMYFTAEQVKNLFNVIRNNFPGATIFAELCSTMMVKNQKHHDLVDANTAPFKWGVRRSRDVEELCPFMKLTGEWNLSPEFRRFSPVLGSVMMLFQQFNNRVARYEIVG
jgi:O-methyltransferase involved in polyketide biosynthesis